MELLNNKGYVSFNTFKYFEGLICKDKKEINKYLGIIAELIRFNTLLSVARSGTGHLGASLSIIEILAEVYFRSFNLNPQNLKSKDRDAFILSKGHAAPSLYATLSAKGYFPIEHLDKLRRLGSLPGHCDIETSGVEANTGSLAIGLSKAVGYAIAKKRFGIGGNVIVVVGDGELQEGQCWEALLSAASFKLDNLYIVIDDNKVQTDQYTKNIVRYGDVKRALKNLGFAVVEEDGRSLPAIFKSLKQLKNINSKPKLLWCHTIKGQGVSFMEHTHVLKSNDDRYIWHNKAPNKEQLEEALNEIIGRNKKILTQSGFRWDLELSLSNIPIAPIQVDIKGDNLISGLKEGLIEAAKIYKNIVVLDADLEEDCGFVEFHKRYPDRFFEMGIMEQHLVLVASSFARMGYIPVFSSYAAFLTSRANEQLYNLASEGGKALIIGNMAGVLPATPGKSHAGFRDIACMKNIPGIFMYQPINATDVKNALKRYFNGEFGNILYLRLSMASSAVQLPSPSGELEIGKIHTIKKGKDIIVVGIGPVVLGECMRAAKEILKKGMEVEIWNHPWIIDFDLRQWRNASIRAIPLVIVEDHYARGGFGESLLSFLAVNQIRFAKIKHIALSNFPKTGFREEVLASFGLDRKSLGEEILTLFK